MRDTISSIEEVVRQYYYAGSQRVAMREKAFGQEAVYLLHGDHLGSTTVVSTLSGGFVSSQHYKPWGEVRHAVGELPTDYGFTGQRSEMDGIGLYYYNARWYDPVIGRFVQADPIVPLSSQGVQAFDRYAYVNNNPVKYNDPTGHSVPIPYDPCQHGCPIIDMSGWTNEVQLVVSAVLFVADNLLYGRTGLIEDRKWGILPAVDYYSTGNWMAPPFLGGVVGGADDIARSASRTMIKAYTKDNFRKNLRHLTGKNLDDMAGMEAHHVLPKEFSRRFENVGLNPHDPLFGSWVEKKAHRTWSYNYNQRWRFFLEKKRSKDEILNFALELSEEYGFNVYFQTP
jgi:RHS repeat-associated protein